MSTYLHLTHFDIVTEVYKRQQEAELFREKEFRAALRVQAWWRGARLRQYMKYLHQSSTVIQAAYRGHLARRRFARIVSEQVNCMKQRHYDVMATKIQTRWRGYYTRKYKHDYYARKAYLRAVQQRNYDVRHALDQYAESQRDQAEMAARKQLEEEKMLQARRFHYLRSTYQINGVFASPWQPQHEFEKRLTSVKPLSKEERDRLFPKSTTRSIKTPDDLPPVRNAPQQQRQRQQGPFRAPDQVWEQRYRPLSPTLRMATAFDAHIEERKKESNDEWVKRIQNEPMRVSGRTAQQPYKKLLHTQSTYGEIPYGSKYFREESKKNASNKEDFKSVVPPIPIFDKFGKTFSKGTVY